MENDKREEIQDPFLCIPLLLFSMSVGIEMSGDVPPKSILKKKSVKINEGEVFYSCYLEDEQEECVLHLTDTTEEELDALMGHLYLGHTASVTKSLATALGCTHDIREVRSEIISNSTFSALNKSVQTQESKYDFRIDFISQ